jgi:ParB family chromosome partitioning protein
MSKKQKSAMASMLAQLNENSLDLDSSVKQLKPIDESLDNSKGGFLEKIDYYGLKKNQLIEIDPENCILWKHKDRHSSDLGNIDELAKDIEAHGQVVPGIVRLSATNSKQYEIIAGERRWRACLSLKIKFKAILETLTDKEASIVQAAENLNRRDLSEYSRGLNYHNLIDSGVFTQAELSRKLNISKANMSSLLSFADLPSDIIELFPDISRVSSRTAAEVRAIYNKGGKPLEALKTVLPKLPITAGLNKLNQLVQVEINGDQAKVLAKKVYAKNDVLLFTVKSDGEKMIGLSFPLSIVSKIDE